MAAQPIEATCNSAYHAFHVDGHRDPADVKWIVLHDAEAPSAEGVAAYFQLPSSGGSAHLVVDDDACFRCLTNREVPRAAPGANHAGFHIEQAGFARWSSTAWLFHRDTLRRAAYKTALHCDLFGIPVTWLDAAALKAGKDGITTHRECTRAFGGTHTDPGMFWPRRTFMRYVREYAAQLDT